MTANVGTIDRAIRALAGLALILIPALGLFGFALGSTLSYVMIAVGVVLVLTATLRFCPAYRLLGLSTCPR